MSLIEAAITAVEALNLAKNLYILKYMVLIVERSRGDTKLTTTLPPAREGAPALYKAPHVSRHPSYTAYDTTLCLTNSW